jgi:hypothetical protein
MLLGMNAQLDAYYVSSARFTLGVKVNVQLKSSIPIGVYYRRKACIKGPKSMSGHRPSLSQKICIGQTTDKGKKKNS